MKKDLKTVIITGGGSGIGLEISKSLLETQEYRIVILGKIKDQLDQAVSQLGKIFDQVSSVLCDLTDPVQVKKAVEKVAGASRGEIYGLINNAGIYPFGGIQSTTVEAWDETFRINTTAPFLMAQAVVPHMEKANRGRIINISSTAGLLPNHFALAYSVSKAALIHFTKTLAKEVGKHNITVNCVCPGIVRSPMHEAYHHNSAQLEEFYAKRGSTFPIARIGEPKDVAQAVKFVLSEENSWMTGDVLVIDGGRVLQ